MRSTIMNEEENEEKDFDEIIEDLQNKPIDRSLPMAYIPPGAEISFDNNNSSAPETTYDKDQFTLDRNIVKKDVTDDKDIT